MEAWRTAAAPVIVQQGDEVRLAGFCEVEGAAERTMLTLPGTIGLPDPAVDVGNRAIGRGRVTGRGRAAVVFA